MLSFLNKKKTRNKVLPKLSCAMGVISSLFFYTYHLGNTNNNEYTKYTNLALKGRETLEKLQIIKEDISDLRFYKDKKDYYNLNIKNNIAKLKQLEQDDLVYVTNLEKAYNVWLSSINSINEESLHQVLKDRIILLQNKENNLISLASVNRTKNSNQLYLYLNYTIILNIFVILLSYLVVIKEVIKANDLEETLEDNQTIFNKFMDATSNIAWIKTKDSKIIYINKRFKEVFGLKALNKTDDEWLPQEIAALNIKNDLEALLSSEPTQLVETAPGLDNKNRTWLVNKFSLGLLNDVFIGGTATDITPIAEAEKLLESTNDELRVSNEEIQQFIYIASHDLQEPIRMVHNYVQLLETYLSGLNIVDERLDKYTKFILGGSSRMKVLVDDVLQYSRAGNKDINYEEINVNYIVSNVLTLLSTQIEKAEAVIEVDDFPNIVGNYSQIEQVFTNLISNSIKFVKQSSPHIKVTYNDNGEYHLFKVIDNGIGIEEQDFSIIFEVFERLHTKEEYPGTGIGLAICKKIIKKHGGIIWVESQVGVCTTFCFTIPKKSKGKV